MSTRTSTCRSACIPLPAPFPPRAGRALALAKVAFGLAPLLLVALPALLADRFHAEPGITSAPLFESDTDLPPAPRHGLAR